MRRRVARESKRSRRSDGENDVSTKRRGRRKEGRKETYELVDTLLERLALDLLTKRKLTVRVFGLVDLVLKLGTVVVSRRNVVRTILSREKGREKTYTCPSNLLTLSSNLLL